MRLISMTPSPIVTLLLATNRACLTSASQFGGTLHVRDANIMCAVSRISTRRLFGLQHAPQWQAWVCRTLSHCSTLSPHSPSCRFQSNNSSTPSTEQLLPIRPATSASHSWELVCRFAPLNRQGLDGSDAGPVCRRR